MEWTRTDTIALARPGCTTCHGVGLQFGRGASVTPCNCVLRAIFRSCYNRFRYCESKEKFYSRVSLEYTGNHDLRGVWGLKDEEYVADFLLVSKRSLNCTEYDIFRFHFLLGADWKLCCRRLNMNRGQFFHAVYAIQAKLGRIYRELRPYSLYPLDEYFNKTMCLDSSRYHFGRRESHEKVIPIRPRVQPGITVEPLLKTA